MNLKTKWLAERQAEYNYERARALVMAAAAVVTVALVGWMIGGAN